MSDSDEFRVGGGTGVATPSCASCSGGTSDGDFEVHAARRVTGDVRRPRRAFPVSSLASILVFLVADTSLAAPEWHEDKLAKSVDALPHIQPDVTGVIGVAVCSYIFELALT